MIICRLWSPCFAAKVHRLKLETEMYVRDCSGVILAGGENRRMPVLKAFISVHGERIIELNIRLLRDHFHEVLVVTNQPEHYFCLGVPLIGDVYDFRGPLSGVFSALLNASSPWIFVTACDMPYLNRDIFLYMAARRKGCDAVIPVIKGSLQPLFAFYSRRLLQLMERKARAGSCGMQDFMKDKRVKYITDREIAHLDSNGLSFVNLNTPGDIDSYLEKEDIINFKKGSKRRSTCLV